jgi:hypothetical protein
LNGEKQGSGGWKGTLGGRKYLKGKEHNLNFEMQHLRRRGSRSELRRFVLDASVRLLDNPVAAHAAPAQQPIPKSGTAAGHAGPELARGSDASRRGTDAVVESVPIGGEWLGAWLRSTVARLRNGLAVIPGTLLAMTTRFVFRANLFKAVSQQLQLLIGKILDIDHIVVRVG